MADLWDDYQFELDGVRFGTGQPIQCLPEGFTPGDVTIDTEVTNHPTAQGVLMGKDRRRNAVWAFDLFVDQSDPKSALATLADLRNVWWDEEAEETPGKVVELRYRIGGRTRVVYGRGRRFTAPPTNLILGGRIDITADFELTYPYTFDDAESSVTIEAQNFGNAAAGIQSPLESPLLGLGGEEPQYGKGTVGGEGVTWPVIEFNGPSLNPWVSFAGWRYQLDATLGMNDTVIADSRPWMRTVLMNGINTVRAFRTSRLASLSLRKGTYTMGYGSLESGPSAGATIRWRNAYKSL